MLSFMDYKRMSPPTDGEQLRRNAQMVRESTWSGDSSARLCYLYDWAHDDQSELSCTVTDTHTVKQPAEVKFIPCRRSCDGRQRTQYKILLRPSEIIPSYYEEAFGPHAEFPVGLYLDIPDEKNVYHKWLICDSLIEAHQTAYTVLPCNYEFHWIMDGRRYRMWGISRLRNRCPSTAWDEDHTDASETTEEIWLPENAGSRLLSCKQRLIVSAFRPQPLTWEISAIKNIHPFGILKLKLSPVPFNSATDYVDPETGEMWADYHTREMPPLSTQEPELDPPYVLSCSYQSIKTGGSARTIQLQKRPARQEAITASGQTESLPSQILWQFAVDGQDISSRLEVIPQDSLSVKVKVPAKLYAFTNAVLTVRAANVPSYPLELKIISL